MNNEEIEIETIDEWLDFETIYRLGKDLKEAAQTLGRDEARFLVDAYYRMQEQRIRFNAQIREMTKEDEPHQLLDWFGAQSSLLEKQCAAGLDVYSVSTSAGRWARSICGVGPVITAGLIAHIDIEKVHYAGQIWSYAGLTNTEWKKGQKRPWNAALKTLCYKIGESFVKVQNNERDTYGHLFAKRKSLEWEKNLKGENGEAAAAKAAVVGKDTIAYKWYSGQINPKWAKAFIDSGKAWPQSIPKKAMVGKGVPMLPPAHIHARARRWAVKLFLSHLFEVMYIAHHGVEPEQPFALTLDGHSRKIHVPNIDLWLEYEGISL